MKETKDTAQAKIPVHQWTHDGNKVLVVRQCAHDGSSSHGFVWPKIGSVECPDWKPHNNCGNGLHGWPWGLAMGDGAEPDFTALWLVVAVDPKDIIAVENARGKVKFRCGEVVFAGEWWKARELTEKGRNAWIVHFSDGKSSATGDRSASSATGYRSASSATGDASVAVCTGTESTARAGEWGVIALAWWNKRANRAEMRCARVVDGKRGTLKPGVAYRLNGRGRFVEVKAEVADAA